MRDVPARRAGFWVIALVVLAGGAPGCSSNSAAPSSEEASPQVARLKQIYLMAQMRTKGNQPRPKTLSDFKQSEKAYPEGFKALQDGECVFVWSAYVEPPANPAATILAYEKGAPDKGGYAVMADGTVKQLPAEEFKSVPRK
jgi:hypothetical protein